MKAGFSGFDLTIKKKILMRIKLTVLLITIALCSAHAEGTAQTVTLSGKGLSYQQVFDAIKKQTGYATFYNDNILSSLKPVTLSVWDMPLHELLDSMLKDQPLGYAIQGKTIVISRKPVPAHLIIIITPIRITVRDSAGLALPGASVAVKGSKRSGVTDATGALTLQLNEGDIVVVSFVGHETRSITITPAMLQNPEMNITLKPAVAELDQVEVVVNTGYQQIPKERATGSFAIIDNKLFNRQVSSDLLSRIEGIAPGILFSRVPMGSPGQTATWVRIRGEGSLDYRVNKDPLFVIDNFPYEGNLSNLNPNDIQSITVLKDAAASSIWGARAANGVIVITTKSGQFNQRMKVDFNASVTLAQRPNVYYDRKYIASKDQVEAERTLFNSGYYDSDLANTTISTYMTPVVEILQKGRLGQLTPTQVDQELNKLAAVDMRDDYTRYIQQNAYAQRYAVNVNGGSNIVSYYLGLGYDINNTHLKYNNSNRFTLTAKNTFSPHRKIKIKTDIIYTSGRINNNNEFYSPFGVRVPTRGLQMSYIGLTDGRSAGSRVRNAFADSLQSLGFFDWQFRPLDELHNTQNITNSTNLLLRGTVEYEVLPGLHANFQFQSERENAATRKLAGEASYYIRDRVNSFAQYDHATKIFQYPFPLGGQLTESFNNIKATNGRLNLSYNRSFGDHTVNAIAGSEMRESKTGTFGRTSYGYDDKTGSSVVYLDYLTFFPTNGGNGDMIYPPEAGNDGSTQRFISHYANAAYTYKGRYTLSASGRKDGANLFGVRTNDKVTPMWSAGLAWDISRESFYSIPWLSQLKLRTTYGYNGSVYPGSAFLTMTEGSIFGITNLPGAFITSAPNSTLRWEKHRMINLGIDFGILNGRINGSIEYYAKKGEDLIDNARVAPSTGFTTIVGNAATTKGKGIDIQINSTNIQQGNFRWQTTFILSSNRTDIVTFNNVLRGQDIAHGDYGQSVQGRIKDGLYSYPWAGLDPATGAPLGYSGKNASSDYLSIINNATIDSLIFHGSVNPLVFGNIMNTFSYKRLSLSFNVVYKLNYYFKHNTPVLDLPNLLTFQGMHADYGKRWRKPGDENITSVPSFSLISDPAKNDFYQNAAINVDKGDHLRLHDVRLSYNLVRPAISFTLQANDLGILWKANDMGLDPDYAKDYVLPPAKNFSFSVTATF